MSRQAPGWPGDTPLQRISKLLERLDASLDAASSESKQLLKEARAVSDGLDPYLDDCTKASLPILAEMIQAADAVDWDELHRQKKTQFRLIPTMCAGGYEAVVLEMLAKIQGGSRILEIGMFIGTSTLTLATLPQVDRVVTLEFEPYLLEFASPFFERQGVREKIDVRLGDAKQKLRDLALEGQKFDVAFIDADKEGYPSYFRAILDLHLLAPKGIIILDNTIYKGTPFAPHPMFNAGARPLHEVNRLAVTDERVETVMLPIRDGLTICRLRS